MRLVNLPVGAEGENPRGYLQKMLPKWIPSLKGSHSNLEVEKAHRIFSNNTSGPRTMIFRLLHHADRQAILEGARKANPSLPDGTKLRFFTDFSPGMVQERQAYRETRAKLRQKGIDSYLVYPAILKVNYKGKKMLFTSVEDAREALNLSVLDSEEGNQG